MGRVIAIVFAGILVCAEVLIAQGVDAVEVQDDSLRIRFSDTDMRAAIQALARHLTKPVLIGDFPAKRITFFETPIPIPTDGVPELLKGIVEAHGLTFVEDSAFYRITAGSPAGRPAGIDPTAEAEAEEPVLLHTIRLKHARAADVAGTLNLLFGTGGGFSGPSGLSRGTLSDELRRDTGRATRAGGASAAPERSAGATLQAEVVIVPDELTNSLLVRATERDFDVLQSGIDQLDVRPLQVLIEVVIVEARRDRSWAFGLDGMVPPQSVAGGTIEGELLGGGLGDFVVRIMKLGRYEINARLSAARSRGDVEILSRPVILASNNTEARLLVGTQQPFIQVSRSLPTDVPQRDQVVQFRDVGTKLTVRPTINADGYVSLVIQQEISSVTGETQFDAPVISTREASTRVLVRDQQTVVIGGLRDKVTDRIRTGIPLLSDIPLIGALFGSSRSRTVETELFLFITPTILRDDEDAQSVTESRMPEALREEHLRPLVSGNSESQPTGSRLLPIPHSDPVSLRPPAPGAISRPVGQRSERPSNHPA